MIQLKVNSPRTAEQATVYRAVTCYIDLNCSLYQKGCPFPGGEIQTPSRPWVLSFSLALHFNLDVWRRSNWNLSQNALAQSELYVQCDSVGYWTFELRLSTRLLTFVMWSVCVFPPAYASAGGRNMWDSLIGWRFGSTRVWRNHWKL